MFLIIFGIAAWIWTAIGLWEWMSKEQH